MMNNCKWCGKPEILFNFCCKECKNKWKATRQANKDELQYLIPEEQRKYHCSKCGEKINKIVHSKDNKEYYCVECATDK